MLKIELEDNQMHKIALLHAESSITKVGRCINMYYSSITLNKDSERLFIDQNGIYVECQLTCVDNFDFNIVPLHKKGAEQSSAPDRISMKK